MASTNNLFAALITAAVMMLLLLSLPSCGGSDLAAGATILDQQTSALPDSAEALRFSSTWSAVMQGVDAETISGGTVQPDGSLVLGNTGPGEQSAIYSYLLQDSWPAEIRIALEATEGEAHVALANTRTGGWDVSPAVTGDFLLRLDNWTAYRSPDDNLHIGIAASGPSNITIKTVSIRTVEDAAYDYMQQYIEIMETVSEQFRGYDPFRLLINNERTFPEYYDEELGADTQPFGIRSQTINPLRESYGLCVTFALRDGRTNAWHRDSTGNLEKFGAVETDGLGVLAILHMQAVYLAQQACYDKYGNYADFMSLEANELIASTYAANNLQMGFNILRSPANGGQTYTCAIATAHDEVFAFNERGERLVDLP